MSDTKFWAVISSDETMAEKVEGIFVDRDAAEGFIKGRQDRYFEEKAAVEVWAYQVGLAVGEWIDGMNDVPLSKLRFHLRRLGWLLNLSYSSIQTEEDHRRIVNDMKEIQATVDPSREIVLPPQHPCPKFERWAKSYRIEEIVR